LINLVKAITNLVKGADQNKIHFYEHGGPQKFLKYLTQPIYIENVKFTELIMSTLKNMTEFKAVVKNLMKDDGEATLQKVLPKCFEMTDSWCEEARNIAKLRLSNGTHPDNNSLNVMEKLVDEK
jgi:hypothetical protein